MAHEELTPIESPMDQDEASVRVVSEEPVRSELLTSLDNGSHDGSQDGSQDRPEGLPDKFWDAENGEILTDTLISSYRSLEQKLGGAEFGMVPNDPSGYRIELQEHPGMEINEGVNTRLHTAGFTGAQAQLVYDLAAEYLPEISSEIGAQIALDANHERLVERFGGERQWNETAAQTLTWGKANLPQEAFESLAGTYDGVLQMQTLMNSNEPSLVRDGRNAGGSVSEESLRALMRDPRYWRDHDPAIVSQVTQGFEALYPEKG